MLSSAECQKMIDMYENIKKQILGLFSFLSDCAKTVDECKVYTDAIIIDDEPVDKGDLAQLTLALDGFKEAFNTVIGECESMISKYAGLKNEALKREAAALLLSKSSGNQDNNGNQTDVL